MCCFSKTIQKRIENNTMTKREENISSGGTGGKQQPPDTTEGVALPMNLMKSLRRKNTSSSSKDSEGSNSSSNGAEGNNSDNSALVSLGNTSFGFNFDSEEGNSSPPNSERNGESNGESDSDGGNGNNSDAKANSSSGSSSERREKQQVKRKQEESEGNGSSSDNSNRNNNRNNNQVERPPGSVPQHRRSLNTDRKSSLSMTSSLSSSDGGAAGTTSHNKAADAAVANLHSIASAYMSQTQKDNSKESPGDNNNNDDAKGRMDSDSNGGYNTDDEGARGLDRKIAASRHPDQTMSAASSAAPQVSLSSGGTKDTMNADEDPDDMDEPPKKKKKKGGGDKKREERNAREKERSFRISKQINELRELLSSGGVIVPKGTKSSVLTEAANYIRMLQQHQYRSEMYVVGLFCFVPATV